jgi:carboxymethylenebutenolidase
MGTRITFGRVDGQDAPGYLAKAGAARAPGVVVIQEWWGLQDQIRGICDRLALAGYDALAPDLYAGRSVPYHDPDKAGEEMRSLNFRDSTDQVVRGAAIYLGRAGTKVGITGFCMGGAVTIIAAARVPEFAAAAPFYGLPQAGTIKAADIRVPLQGHFANQDESVTPARVDAFEADLKAAGKTFEIFRYDAKHAFMNEQRSVHDRKCAEQAWARLLAFWNRHLA